MYGDIDVHRGTTGTSMGTTLVFPGQDPETIFPDSSSHSPNQDCSPCFPFFTAYTHFISSHILSKEHKSSRVSRRSARTCCCHAWSKVDVTDWHRGKLLSAGSRHVVPFFQSQL